MYRKYIADLESWLARKNRKPLIVWGARQVGKTYLIKDLFAKQHFGENYIYIDCRTEYRFTEFCETHLNVHEIIEYLSLETGKKIDSSTLLIFDEAQECLPVITLMKYFNQDAKEIPVIVTGSMVRITIQRESRKRGAGSGGSFLFPVGNINQLTVYPMNFGEFLYNKNRPLYKKITDAYHAKTPFDAEIHQLALDTFYEYLMIGGMPEAVDTYFTTKSALEAKTVLKDLYDNYLSDMELYQASPESVVRAKKIFQNIYPQLNKESKNFKCTGIEAGARYRDMRSPIDWLTLAFVVSKSTLVKEHVTLPLIESEESLFRLYLCDAGIFSYQSGINATSFLTSDGRNTLSGIFFENYAACELTAAGVPLFYWKGKGNSEFEFIVESDSAVIPIDVKKSRGRLTSLEKFKDHNAFSYAVKVSADRFGFDAEKKILTIPFYQFFLAAEDLGQKKSLI
ncbi:MAG TPA: AAA family ATPase [Methanocorpusculum sp.]|nr:AAA family ATPase [Methanocorpusculum sp.]